MKQLFATQVKGEPFILFGFGHLVAIVLLLLAVVCLPLIRKYWDERGKRIFRYSLIAWMLGWEIAWHIWSYYDGSWTIQTHLPLHLCTLFTYLSMYMLATRSYSIYELAYFAGIGGAMQAIFTPDTGGLGFPHFRAFQIFASHGGIILAAMYMTIVEGYRPTLKSFKQIILWANIYMLFIFFVNMALGSNYMFISYKPTDFYSVLDYLTPWPWYILELEVMGIAVFILLYIPFLIKDLRARLQTSQA
jgi:hypothetical integral membrane protein (TIGR02206 family)